MNSARFFLTPTATTKRERELQQRYCSLLMDCASDETMDLLPALAELNQCLRRERWPTCDSVALWQLKLVVSVGPYCASIKENFLEALKVFVSKHTKEMSPLIVRYLQNLPSTLSVTPQTAFALQLCDVPPYALLSPLQGKRNSRDRSVAANVVNYVSLIAFAHFVSHLQAGHRLSRISLRNSAYQLRC